MPTVTITIPDDFSAQLEPYRETLAEFLRIGLQEVKKAQGFTLYKQGHLSIQAVELLIQEAKTRPELWISAQLCDRALEQSRQEATQRLHP
jgi:hypothetical protein